MFGFTRVSAFFVRKTRVTDSKDNFLSKPVSDKPKPKPKPKPIKQLVAKILGACPPQNFDNKLLDWLWLWLWLGLVTNFFSQKIVKQVSVFCH